MGKFDFVIDLVETTAKYPKACGKRAFWKLKTIAKFDTCGLKYTPQLKNDVFDFSQSPLVNLFNKVNKANNLDDFTILSYEIDRFKCSESVRKELIKKYTERYHKVNKEHLLNKPYKPEVLFKNIFGKDLTTEEAKELCAKYKAIIEEPNLLNYIGKLITQVKEDYDIVPMFKINMNVKEGIGLGANGAMSNTFKSIHINYYSDNPLNKIKIFDIVMHELKHAKQNELALAVNKDAYINALVVNSFKIPENSKFTVNQLENYYSKFFDEDLMARIKAKYGTIDKESLLYKQGMDYIESTRNYTAPMGNFDEEFFRQYKKQLVEKEAYDVSESAIELYYMLMRQ